MRFKPIYVLLLTVLPAIQAKANNPDDVIRPYKIHVQYAGNLGLISVGLGKPYLNNKLNMFILYGYLPKAINGVKVHTLALKSSFTYASTRISSNYDLDYYLGITTLYSIAKNTYMQYPDYFPDNYYSVTNAIHFCPHLGLQTNVKFIPHKPRDLHVFLEIGTIDYKLWSAITTRYINIFKICNISFGIVFTKK